MTEIARHRAEEHVLGLAWSDDGALLAVTPSTGAIALLDAEGNPAAVLPGHGLGNGATGFRPAAASLATCGMDGRVRIYPEPSADPVEVALGKGWVEAAKWSPDGAHLAAALGRRLLVLDAAGATAAEFADHRSTVCDFCWNPANPGELASVCDGGAHMWRIGESEPFARFDWGGASLLADWSPDGRWLVTGDQTPSVHLYDFTRDYPLHIQGYEAKVKAFSFNSASRSLATGGGRLVTVWPLTGKRGPEGVVPRQLQAHNGDVVALAYRRSSDQLASGGSDGLVAIFEPQTATTARATFDAGAAVTALAWQPGTRRLAAGTEDGEAILLEID